MTRTLRMPPRPRAGGSMALAAALFLCAAAGLFDLADGQTLTVGYKVSTTTSGQSSNVLGVNMGHNSDPGEALFCRRFSPGLPARRMTAPQTCRMCEFPCLVVLHQPRPVR